MRERILFDDRDGTILEEPHDFQVDSFEKMREMSIGYDVPKSFLQKVICGVKQASVSFVAQNPWLIYSAVPNIDPSEMGAADYNFLEGGQAVSVRTFGFTVNLTF